MAEALEEFVNGAATLVQLTAGHVLVTNTSDQRALVTDIQISNPSAVPLSLINGATTLLSGNTDATLLLSGKSIVGASASLQLKTSGVAGLFNKFQTFRQGQMSTVTAKTHFSGSALPSAAAAVSQTTITSALTTITPYFAFIAANGNFYYHANTGGTTATALYKRAGGVNGTQTTLDASFGAICFSDGVRWIYGITSNNTLKKCDTTTDTVTTVTIAPTMTYSINAAYAHGAAMDGYVFCREYQASHSMLINAATGAAVELTSNMTTTTNRAFVAMAKNTAGDYLLIQTDNTSLYYTNIGPTLSTSPSVKASGTIAVPFSQYIGSCNQLFRATHLDNYLIFIPQGTTSYAVRVLDLTTFTYIGQVLSGPTSTDLTTGMVLAYDSTLATADAPSVTVRATGIKIT